MKLNISLSEYEEIVEGLLRNSRSANNETLNILSIISETEFADGTNPFDLASDINSNTIKTKPLHSFIDELPYSVVNDKIEEIKEENGVDYEVTVYQDLKNKDYDKFMEKIITYLFDNNSIILMDGEEVYYRD